MLITQVFQALIPEPASVVFRVKAGELPSKSSEKSVCAERAEDNTPVHRTVVAYRAARHRSDVGIAWKRMVNGTGYGIRREQDRWLAGSESGDRSVTA